MTMRLSATQRASRLERLWGRPFARCQAEAEAGKAKARGDERQERHWNAVRKELEG